MSEELLGGLGLIGSYKEGENGWAESMNENLEKLNNIKEQHFISIKPSSDNQTKQGNYNNDGANGEGSIAIGVNALTLSKNAVVIGCESEAAGGENTVILGSRSNSGGAAITVGNYSTNNAAVGMPEEGDSESYFPSILVGHETEMDSPSNIGLGHRQQFNGVNILAIGHAISASGGWGVVIGNGTKGGSNSIVIGDNCDNSGGDSNIILGRDNQVLNNMNIIIGHGIKSGNGGICNIILNPQNTVTDYSTAVPNWSVRIGTGNINANTTKSAFGQVVIGKDNQTDGSHNIIIGQDNRNTYTDDYSEGYGSLTIGHSNQQNGLYNSLLGYGNRNIKSQSNSPNRAHALGTNNDISGFECAIIGNENKFRPTGSYQAVNVDGNDNTIDGEYFVLSVVGSYNSVNAPQNATGQDVIILGHNNSLTGAFRQTVIGSGNTVDETAIETTVIGFNIDAKYSNVTYLGNGASISFNNKSKDYRYAGVPYQFSYLTGDVTYKVDPDFTNRNWYTGKEMLALKPDTVLANVADGGDDNHAVTVRQLKRLAEIQNNDYVLFARANEFAVYNILPDNPTVDVKWHVAISAENNIINVSTLSTKAEKEAWIATNFTVVKEVLDGKSAVVAKLLKYNGAESIQIKNTGTSLDGNTNLEILPATYVLNGGYDALNQVSTVGFSSPINKPNGWEINSSLNPVTADMFYLTPAAGG